MTDIATSQNCASFFKENPLVFRIANGPYAGQNFSISSEKCLIRGQNQNRAQCAVFRGSQHTIVQDLAGNTRINGQPALESALKQGDCIECGDLQLIVESIKHPTELSANQPAAGLDPVSKHNQEMIEKLEGIQDNLRKLDEPSTTADDPSSETNACNENERCANDGPCDHQPCDHQPCDHQPCEKNRLAPAVENDDSADRASEGFEKAIGKLQTDLIRQIGKCRRDLVRLNRDLESQAQDLDAFKADQPRKMAELFANTQNHSNQLDQLVQQVDRVRSDVLEQVEAKSANFSDSWQQEFDAWKQDSNGRFRELCNDFEQFQLRLVQLADQCERSAEQLASLQVPADPQNELNSLREQTSLSLEQSHMVLGRVDRLTDSLEQMSELLKRQVTQFAEVDEKISGLESNVEQLGQTFESRTREFDSRLNQTERQLHERVESSSQKIHRRLEEAAQSQTDRIDNVDEKLSELKGELNNVAGNANHGHQRVDDVRGQLDNVHEQLEEYENRLESLKSCSSDAQDRASRAQNLAELAETRANEAQCRADEAQCRADEAQNLAENANRDTTETQNRINEVDERATRVQELATAAQELATAAQESAKEAQVNSNEAQEKSSNAENKSEAAQNKSNEAQELASRAKELAGEAKEIANEAQSRSDENHGRWLEVLSRVDELNDRNTEENGRIDDLLDRDNEARERLNELDHRHGEIDRQMGEANSRINEVHGRVDEVHGRVDEVHGRVDENRGRIEEVSGRVDGCLERIDQDSSNWQQVWKRFDENQTRLDSGVQNVENLRDKVAETERQNKALESRLDENRANYETRHAAQEQKLDEIENRVANTESLSSRVQAQGSQIAAQDQRLEELQNQCNDSRERCENLASDLTEQSHQNRQFNQKIDLVHSRIEQIDGNLARIDEIDSSLNDQMQPIHERLAEIKQDNESLQSKIDDQAEQLRQHKQSNSECDRRFFDAQNRLEHLNYRLAELDDIRNQLEDLSSDTRFESWELKKLDFESSIEILKEKHQDHDGQFANLREHFVNQDEKLDQFRQWKEHVRSELTHWTEKSESLAEQLEQIRATMDERTISIDGRFARDRACLDELHRWKNASETQESEWADRADSLTNAVRENREQIDSHKNEVERRVSRLEESCDESEDRARSLQKRWERFETEFGESRSRIESLGESLGESVERVSAFESSLEEVKEHLSRISESDQVTPESFQKLSDSVQENQNKLESVVQLRDALQSLEDRFETEKDQTQSHLDEFRRQLNQHEEVHEALRHEWKSSNQLDGVRETLSELQARCQELDENSVDPNLFNAMRQQFEQLLRDWQESVQKERERNERVDQFESRLDENRDQFTQLQDRVLTEEALSNVQESIEEIRSRLEETANPGQLAELRNAVEQLQQKLANTETNDSSEHDDSISDQIQAVRQTVDASKLESQQQNERLSESISDIQAEIPQLKSEFETQCETLSEQRARMDQWAEAQDEKSNRIDESIRGMNEQFGDFKNQLNQFNERLESLETREQEESKSESDREGSLDEDLAGQLRSEIQESRSDLETTKAQLSSLQEDLEFRQKSLDEKVSDLNLQLEENPNRDQLQKDFTGLVSRFEELESRVDTQPDSNAEANSQIETLETKLESACERFEQLEAMKQQLSELESGLANVLAQQASKDSQSELQPAIQIEQEDPMPTEMPEKPVETDSASNQLPTKSEGEVRENGVDSVSSLHFDQLLSQLRQTESPADETGDGSPGEKQDESQQRAQDLENIYEQAVDSVQQNEPRQISDSNLQDWAGSLGAETESSENNPEHGLDPSVDSTEHESVSDSAGESGRDDEESDSKLEDILNRLSSNDNWSGVVSDTDESDSTHSDIIVENNFSGAEVDIVDDPAPIQESVADVLSRMQLQNPLMDSPEGSDSTTPFGNSPVESGTMPWPAQVPEEKSTSESSLTQESPSGPSSSADQQHVEPEASSGDDVSVQEYMSKLFGRLRGDEADEEILASAAAEASESEKPESKTDSSTPMEEAVVANEESTPLSAAEYVPQQQAPSTDINALRQLANESTRKAVSISVKKRTRSLKSLYLALAVGAFAFGGLMFMSTESGLNTNSLLSLCLIAAGAYCGFRFLKTDSDNDSVSEKSAESSSLFKNLLPGKKQDSPEEPTSEKGDA